MSGIYYQKFDVGKIFDVFKRSLLCSPWLYFIDEKYRKYR